VRLRNSRAVSAFKASGMPNLPTSTHAMHANDRTASRDRRQPIVHHKSQDEPAIYMMVRDVRDL
jgi:hypothetical protein